MSESEDPKESSNNDLRNAQFGGGFINAENVNAQRIGGDIHITNYYYREDIRVAAVKPTEDGSTDEKLPCPYRGLFHFSPDDAKYFFGREVFIEELFRATQTQNFIPVLGASGSGKSSVVLAGLVPKLEQLGNWKFTHFRPGTNPFYALAEALVPLYTPDLDATDRIAQTRKLSNYFCNSDILLIDVIAKIQQNYSNHRVLLIADQFEELFTLCNDEKTRRSFLDCLLTIILSPTSKSLSAVFVATMRVDFLSYALSYPEFADQLKADIKIRSMNRAELTDVIAKPAKKLGVIFQDGLIERILDDVKSEPGNLPLLEFALTKLWEKRTNQQLTHAAYEAIGEVQGALASHADTIYRNFNAPEQQQVSQIFMQLVRTGEGIEDTRRVATKAEIGSQNWSLVQHLADVRLLVTSCSSDGQETVEVAHEALIQHWQLLQGWIDENRSQIIQKNKIERLATEWQQNKQLNDYLLRGKQLKQAKTFEKKELTNFALSDLACQFINKSIKFERSRALKIGSLMAIPLLIAFVGIVPFIRQTNEQRAWNTLKDPKNPGVRAAIELLRQGCWARSEWSGIPDFLATSLFGNCANLEKIKLSDANLQEVKLSGANLSGANLSGANLSDAKLNGVQLIRANLSDADLAYADLSDADLSFANLSRARLYDLKLRGAIFGGANLSGAILGAVDFRYVDFRYANLSDADLEYAILSAANFQAADLSGAKLGNADFGCIKFPEKNKQCTNLSNVVNLTPEQVKAAQNWQLACYSPEFRKQLGLPPETRKECKN